MPPAAGTTVVNQIERLFDGLGQLTAEYQSISGAVNLASTPSVDYAYTEMSGQPRPHGGANAGKA